MVKKTVNFDDPQTYHFYFGDEVGTPGTILTFFPWTNVRPGRNGIGMATEIGYSVPKGSLEFWISRLKDADIKYEARENFGEKLIAFQDPDGLWLTLIETQNNDERKGFKTADVSAEVALKGFHTVTLTLHDIKETAAVLTEVFGYKKIAQQDNLFRYQTDAVETAALVDLLEIPQMSKGINAGGTNHHVAFRVKDEETLMAFRQKILDRGLQITEKINRDYFYSLYFREPGGVLFEIATDNPGFATDETVENLGTSLQLPSQYEADRDKIEKALPKLKM